MSEPDAAEVAARHPAVRRVVSESIVLSGGRVERALFVRGDMTSREVLLFLIGRGVSGVAPELIFVTDLVPERADEPADRVRLYSLLTRRPSEKIEESTTVRSLVEIWREVTGLRKKPGSRLFVRQLDATSVDAIARGITERLGCTVTVADVEAAESLRRLAGRIDRDLGRFPAFIPAYRINGLQRRTFPVG